MKVVDMHCDTISELHRSKQEGGRAGIFENSLQIDLKKMEEGDYGLQNFALFVNLKKTERPFEYCMELLDTFYREMEANRDRIGIVRTYEEIAENWKKGRMSALLTVEEGGVCQGNPAFLRDLYRLGVRMMTLTWNHENELGRPNRRTAGGDGRVRCLPETKRGLTETGIEFVEEMERLGMIVDLSHLSDAGIRDVLRHAKKPPAASHSNARALASHPRNLTDEMIRDVADRGGVIGINYYYEFLRDWKPGERPESRISDIVAHMKHMKRVGGIGCIGLGSDFDGMDGKQELDCAARLPLLEQAMERAGFTGSEIEAVFHDNVLRLYRELL